MESNKQGAKKQNKSMTVEEAGRKGGTATSERHGPQFYEAIGKKGGKVGGQRVKELVKKGKDSER